MRILALSPSRRRSGGRSLDPPSSVLEEQLLDSLHTALGPERAMQKHPLGREKGRLHRRGRLRQIRRDRVGDVSQSSGAVAHMGIDLEPTIRRWSEVELLLAVANSCGT